MVDKPVITHAIVSFYEECIVWEYSSVLSNYIE